ncbi:hypothetical protein ACQ4PT_018083 [Festuca glaucescens]
MSNSSPSGRRITVRSISCRGVKSFVPFQKPPLYAAVSFAGRREKTAADPDGGENPDWDGAVFGFDFDGAGEGDDGLLQFEVKAQVPLLGTKLVGTICVPVSHLGSGGGDGTVPQRVSYQVLAPDGKPNGSFSFVCAVTGGASYQQPQIYAVPNGARPEQDPSPCCAPPPPPQSLAYPPPAMPYFEQGSSYPPPPVSTSLYPPLQDMLPPSNYPPPPRMIDSLFPVSNSGSNSSYPLPPTLTTAYIYPPPPASCAAYSVPSTHIPPRYAPTPPPSGYPPQPQMNHEFPAPTSCYPPPPPPESGSIFSVLPRSTSSPAPRSMDHELPYMVSSFQDSVVTYPELHGPRVSSGGSYYPPSGIRHHEDGASSPYYYTHPGPSYSHG